MKLGRAILEYKPAFEVKGIGITYTDYGSFYGIYLYDVPATANVSWKEKIRFFDEAQEYIKELTGFDLPRSYDIPVLEKIVEALKDKGFEADFNDAMDVS